MTHDDTNDVQPKAEDLMQTQKAIHVIGALVCASVMTISSTAMAQSKPAPVELSPTQIETNNRAVRLLSETPPQTKKAIKLVEAALVMEKRGDLLHLTLGRAYQLDGQCALAEEQFAAAELAPGVKGVPEDFVPGQLAEYRSELDACMGTLLIACEPSDLELVMNGASLACDTQVSLEPGAYIVNGVNPTSKIEVEIPVQVVGGQTTRSQIKIPGSRPEDLGDGSGTSVVPDVPTSESGMSWRVTPQVGVGLGTNVIERTSVPVPLVPGNARYPSFADQVVMGMVGVEGRALWHSSSLRYGLGAELRYETSLLDDVDGNDELVFVESGLKLALYPQLWFSKRFGVFLGAAWRPRELGVEISRPNGSGEEIGYWGTTVFTLGGGVKAELGDLLGMRGLELSAAWLQPTSGDAGRLYASNFTYTDEEPRNPVPALELGVRAQFGSMTASLSWEGWHGEALTELCDREEFCFDNQRSSQLMLGLGWSFGD